MDFKELFKEFMIDFPSRLSKFEQAALETGLDTHISISEIHIINKIGPGGSQKMNTIAKRLGVTQATLTVACDKLEAKELIIRQRDPEDKRAVTVRLTPSGFVAYSFHQALMDNLAEMFVSGMTADELGKLTSRMYSIYDKLNY
ncbi:MAG: MarR family transcriptional regulator [Clostridiaceae bacterium]|nr:MarR family transcriptional regulator [Clostridiaceae bacterium]